MSYINAERDGRKVKVWERHGSNRSLKYYDSPLYFYVEDDKGDHISLFGDTCSRLDFDSLDDFTYTRNQFEKTRHKLFESDIGVEYKILAEHYDGAPTPDLNITYIDIEVDYNKEIGFAEISNPYAPINSVALYHQWSNKTVVLAVPPKSWGEDPDVWQKMLDPTLHELADITLFNEERDLLLALLVEIEESDGLCGWNSNFFDMPYIGKRIDLILGKTYFNKLSFDGGRPPTFREVEIFGRIQTTLDLSGRLSIDYLDLFKKFEAENRPSYKLENISEEVLPNMSKLSYEGNLADLYVNDFNFFLRYNIRDTECLKGFEEQLGYVGLANEMFHSSTGLFKNIQGTIKLAELSIINYCHKVLRVVAPNIPKTDGLDGKAEGAFVLQPKAGKQEYVGSIDIASLYPSSIRSINISPETLIGQFGSRVEAFEAIRKQTDMELVFTFESGKQEQKTASEWRVWLKENNMAVSGYGTVFSQDKKGVIPGVLESWYQTRKDFKKLCFQAEQAGDTEKAAYYDRLQYCYKIKLNSLYGALLNRFFRFYDPRMGESTTGTGRAILKHMCGTTNQLLTGIYDEDGEAVVYGDTDSCYFKTFTDNTEEAIAVADAVCAKVNSGFQSFMQESFLCTEGFDDIIEAERECVADAGIFVTPKRYILHLVNYDGKPVDKMKTMGLDIKKTIIPKPIQIALSAFIERYLKGDDWDNIAADIVKLKDELMETDDIFSIGLPKGVNNVDSYTRDWQRDPSIRLPGHVRASIYYNEMLNKYNDKESFAIQSSMKIKIFYLTNKDGKVKSIALPTDLTSVPQWFLDNIDVDRKQQILRLIDKPLDNILKAVGKQPPTKQTIFLDSVIEF